MANLLCGFHGTIKGVPDEFTHTLAVTWPGDDVVVAAQQLATAFETAFADLPDDSWAPAVSGGATWTHVTAAEILSLTAGTLSAAGRANLTAGMAGTGARQPPSQVALAVSLRGGTYPNGTPIRGRFYLPLPLVDATNGLLASAAQAWALNGTIRLFNEMNDVYTFVPCVWSRKAGSLSPVEEVRVGIVCDTIRSRRNNTAESYSTATWPA